MQKDALSYDAWIVFNGSSSDLLLTSLPPFSQNPKITSYNSDTLTSFINLLVLDGLNG